MENWILYTPIKFTWIHAKKMMLKTCKRFLKICYILFCLNLLNVSLKKEDAFLIIKFSKNTNKNIQFYFTSFENYYAWGGKIINQRFFIVLHENKSYMERGTACIIYVLSTII